MKNKRPIHKTIFLKELRDYAVIFLASIFFGYLSCQGCFATLESAIKNGSYSFLAWALFWKGNAYIANYLDDKISWTNQTLRRFGIGITCMIVYTVSILFLIQYFFYMVGYTGAKIAPVSVYIFSIGITVFISLLVHSAAFLRNWRQAELLNAKLKNERLSSQYEALKSQVNPHFLFNSLNALTSLVYEDQDQAAKFIQQLSKVYRYVLDNREKGTVSLDTEINFVESYLFLQKIRYGDNLQYAIQIPAGATYRVAPLSVQMLIENAIKHNTISIDEPLKIDISIDEGGYLVTRNNLQVKNIINEYSGIGLENIKARYEYFTRKPVVVDKNGKEFIVKLPLIEREQEDIIVEEKLVKA